jgi:hypothetical protein
MALCGETVFCRGSLRVALRHTVANPNPAFVKTATVTSACKAFCRPRRYWRMSVAVTSIHQPGPTTSMPLSGIGQDQIASLIKFLRFLRLTGAPALHSTHFSRKEHAPLISGFLCASICCLDLDPGKFLTPVRARDPFLFAFPTVL